MFCSLPSVTRRRAVRQRISVQQSVQRALSTPPEYSRDQGSVSPAEREHTPVQSDPHFIVEMEEMMRQLQETMQAMQQDADRHAEVDARQAEVVTQQAELITRLQQQTGASASHQAPPPPRVPILGETTNV